MPKQTTYSEELQEIMGRIPSRVIRWGTGIIFSVLLIILLLSYLVKYPEMVEVPITITTLNPPADLITKSSGKIEKLFVSDNQKVNTGDIIAILNNIADYIDTFDLEHLLKLYDERWQEYIDSDFVSHRFDAGELQTTLSQFNSAVENYDKYITINYIPQRKENLCQQIGIQKVQLENQKEQLDFMRRQYKLERENVERDSVLHRRGVLSLYEYEKSQQALLQLESSLMGYRNSISQLQANIASNEGQLIELELQYQSEISNLILQLKTTRDNLLAQIRSWRDSYVIEAPLTGMVTFTRYWNENQSVFSGERFATVVPDTPATTDQIIGKLIIPSASLGKIKVGQVAHVKLNGFPYMEFGILKGELMSISAVPDKEGYTADVRFPSGLVSTYNKQFELIHQMDGTAGIVTRDMRLIERFFAPIKNVMLNN